jgi:hypothetical protein
VKSRDGAGDTAYGVGMSKTARVRGVLAALGLVLASTALSGCSASSTGSYCDVLRSVQADWKGSSATLQDPAAAARLASAITQVEASAPEEVKADWESLHTLVQKFTVADPDLAALTKQLQGFESSAKRVEVHARETCQVDLTR